MTDHTALGSGHSQRTRRSDSEQFDATFQEALRTLEAVCGLIGKIQDIASASGTSASDAAMLAELKARAASETETQVLEAVLQLAGIANQAGAPLPAGVQETERKQELKPVGGRFRKLV